MTFHLAAVPDPVALLDGVPSPLAYGVVLGAVLLESVLLVGVFVPTLSLLLCAGFLAYSGPLSLPVVIGCAVAGAVVGDLLAHRTGRRLGPGLRSCRLGRRVPTEVWDRTWSAVRRFGGLALLLCRFVPVVRTFAPYVAGAAGTRYRHLAPYSGVAAVVWASAEAGAGYLAGASYERLAAAGAVPVVVVLAGLGVVVLHVRRRNSRNSRNNRNTAGVVSGRAHRRRNRVGATEPRCASGAVPSRRGGRRSRGRTPRAPRSGGRAGTASTPGGTAAVRGTGAGGAASAIRPRPDPCVKMGTWRRPASAQAVSPPGGS